MKNKKSSASQEAEACPSRCPDNSAFKQQKLPAWKPRLTTASVLSTFFLTGAFCLAVGVSLIVAANSVREIQVCLEWVFGIMLRKRWSVFGGRGRKSIEFVCLGRDDSIGFMSCMHPAASIPVKVLRKMVTDDSQALSG